MVLCRDAGSRWRRPQFSLSLSARRLWRRRRSSSRWIGNSRDPAAPFTVAIDRGYFKAEGLDVTIDTSPGSLEPLNRVASGTYDIGVGDINSLIKFRDSNPNVPLKTVFMLYNKPAFAIVGRKSLGVTKPKDLEGKKLGAPGT